MTLLFCWPKLCGLSTIIIDFYFQPFVNGEINLENIIVDGETHRGKLIAKEVNWPVSKSNISLISIRTMAPEVLKDKSTTALPASDIWSLSARYSLMRKKYDWSKLKNFINEKFRNYSLFLSAFYLIMWLMKWPKTFEKIAILKKW